MKSEEALIYQHLHINKTNKSANMSIPTQQEESHLQQSC